MAQSSIVSTDLKLYYAFNAEEGNDRRYIDIAQSLSIVNRRSYRQGMNYAVAKIEVFSPTGGNLGIFTIPNTWVADNATTKAFEAWKDQRAEVLKEQPSLKAKWSDFKIFMDAGHEVLGSADNLIPFHVDSAAPYLKGDWDSSQFVVPLPGADQAAAGDAQEVHMHVVGDHVPAGVFNASTTSVGLIKAYAASRALPLAPDPVQQGQYLSGFYNIQQSSDEKSEDIMDNVSNKNDSPPYSLDKYPGSDLNAVGLSWLATFILNDFGDASAWSQSFGSGAVIPFGLLMLNTASFSSLSGINVVVTLVPGSYKGVLAEKGV